ncbi:class I SAM-dependent methyltransferase [Thermoproteota archaeon]
MRHLDQYRFKLKLDRNASKMLAEVGISEGQSVLDFGCGSGTYSIPAANLVGKNGRIYSLDVRQGSLEKLTRKTEKEGLDNIVTLLSSGNVDIPIDNEALNHVLQEISDKETLLEEIHRILKPDGMMIVYPMHIDSNEVTRLASNVKLRLKGKIFQEQILVFEKV